MGSSRKSNSIGIALLLLCVGVSAVSIEKFLKDLREVLASDCDNAFDVLDPTLGQCVNNKDCTLDDTFHVVGDDKTLNDQRVKKKIEFFRGATKSERIETCTDMCVNNAKLTCRGCYILPYNGTHYKCIMIDEIKEKEFKFHTHPTYVRQCKND